MLTRCPRCNFSSPRPWYWWPWTLARVVVWVLLFHWGHGYLTGYVLVRDRIAEEKAMAEIYARVKLREFRRAEDRVKAQACSEWRRGETPETPAPSDEGMVIREFGDLIPEGEEY